MVAYDRIPESKLKEINSICILSFGLIGDVFIRISLLEAIKRQFPDSNITVIVDPPGAVALENNPFVDTVIKLSRKKNPVLRYIFRTLPEYVRLNRKHFDLSVDLYCGGSSVFATWVINAKNRICYGHKKSLRRVNNYLVTPPSFCENWTLALGKMLLPLGIEKVRRGTSYHCGKSAIEYANNWLVTTPGKNCVINLGAGAENKIWKIEKFVKLAELIQKKHSYHPIVLTNPGQTHLVKEFTELAAGKIDFTILPETSFANVAAVISKVGLIITGDTSIMHLAFGLKCPTLGIFTRTRPEIVDPEDSIHVACFLEGKERNDCGKLYGTQELTPEACYNQFNKLLLRME